MSYGQYIDTSGTQITGNIYHTGGNLGIGTKKPEKLLHVSSDSEPTLRLTRQSNYGGLSWFVENWDIINDNSLRIAYSYKTDIDTLSPTTKLLLDAKGRLVLNSDNIEESAMLNINSSSMGVLIPRMNTTQINNIASPAEGLLVYNNQENIFQYFLEGNWQSIETQENINSANYLTVDSFNTTVASEITSTDVAHWNTAYSWGNQGEQSVWTHTTNATILQNPNDFVGIGTKKPSTNLQITSGTNTTIRLENLVTSKIGIPPIPDIKPNHWDITNSGNLLFNSSLSKENYVVSFSPTGQIGVGTNDPQATLHLKSADDKPTIRFEGIINNGAISDTIINPNLKNKSLVPAYWNIAQDGCKLNFNFSLKNGTPQNILSIEKSTSTALPTSPNKLTFKGTIDAQKLTINGQNITSGVWEQDGSNIFYNNGNVGIGTNYIPDNFVLATKGKIITEGFYVEHYDNWPDYVFQKNHSLPNLAEIENYIEKNNHLPNIPNADSIKNNGYELEDMDAMLLQKIEELTLYIIEQDKQIKQLQNEIKDIKNK